MTERAVLAVDDEPDVLRCLVELLESIPGVRADGALTAAAARAMAQRRAYDMVVADHRLRDGSGAELLAWVGARAPGTILVLQSALEEAATLAPGAPEGNGTHFALKPWDPEALRERVADLLASAPGATGTLGR